MEGGSEEERGTGGRGIDSLSEKTHLTKGVAVRDCRGLVAARDSTLTSLTRMLIGMLRLDALRRCRGSVAQPAVACGLPFLSSGVWRS